MSLILDAGAFLAVERGDRDVMALVKAELIAKRVPSTHGGVIGQVWRGGTGKQAMLARFLGGVRVEALDDALGRRIGMVLRRARTSDVIDAGVVLMAVDGDMIVTSDPGDLEPLAIAADVHVDFVPA